MMKSEKTFFNALEAMLRFYEKCRENGYSKDKALEKTLETYKDFYNWLLERV